ncbi:zinc finger protein 638 isoform X2 [Crotalus tigris]|nr:zinc finger protein 638 isoform X2 [Crotalus tigris]
MKCLGPRIVEHIHKQAFGQGFSGGKKASPDFEEGKTGNPSVPSKLHKKEGHSRHGSSEAKAKVTEAADGPKKEETATEGKPKKPPSEAPVKEADALNKFWSKPRSLGTILQISELPEDGFTDQDIKKIVQPFGKVSDILVDRCKHEAYLEMNYKEAVIAAVKFNETSPVLINGKRVKISVAEKPKVASTQSKGNEKKVAQNVKDPALNNKKEQVAPVVKMKSKETLVSAASKTDTKKPGKVVKSGEPKAAVKPKKTTEAKKPGAAAVKQNNTAEAAPSEEGKPPPKGKKVAEAAKSVDPKVKEPPKTKKLAEPKDKEGGPKSKDKEGGPKSKKAGEPKAKEPVKAKKGTDPKAKESLKAKKGLENKKASEPPKAKKAAEPKKEGDSKDAKEPVKVKKVTESKESPKEPKAGESSQASGESQAKEPSKPAEAPDKSEAVESPEVVESANKDAEEMCVVMISSFPEAGLSLEEIRNLTKPFGKVKDILIVSSHKKAYIEISRKSADSMVKFYTCFPMWVERNQLCISLVPELKDLNEEMIFTAMIKDANPDVNTESLYTQFVHLGNLPDDGYSELEILCVGLRFGRVDHYMVITNKNKAVLQLNSAESAASMCRFLKRYPYSLGEVQLTISRSPRIEPAAADAVKKEEKTQEASQESPDLKTIPEGSGGVHPSAVPPTEAMEDSEAIPDKEPLDSQKTVGAGAPQPPKTEDSEEDAKTIKEEFGLGIPSAVEDSESSERQAEDARALTSAVKKEEKGTDHPDQELPRKASPSGGKANEEAAPLPGKAEEAHAASKEGTPRALSASAAEEGTSTNLGPGPTEGALEETPSAETLSRDRPTSPEADRTEAAVGLAEMPAPKVQVKMEEESGGLPAASRAKVEVAAKPAGAETKENLKEKFQLQLARVEVTLQKLPENLLLGTEELKQPEETPGESTKVQHPEHVVPKTPKGKGPGQTEAEESGKASTPEAETAANPEAASLGKTAPKASNPSKASRLTARRKEEKPAGKPVPKSQGPAEKTPSPKQPSQQRPANGRPSVGPDSAKSKLSTSSVVVVALGPGKSSSQQEKDPPAETKGSPKQSREPESRTSTLKRDAGGNKVSAGRNTRASKSTPKPKEEEELFPFNLDEFVTMDEVVDEVESPQPRRNPVRGKRKDPPKKSVPGEPSSKRKKAKAAAVAVETEVSFVTLDEIGEDEGGMGQVELLNLEAMTDDQGLVTVDEVNEEEELIDEDMKDPQSLVTLDEISEQEDVAPPEMAKEPFASGESEPDLKTEPLLTVDEIGEVEELPLNEPSHFKDEEMLKGKEEGKAGAEPAGDFLSSQIPEDPSVLVTVDEIHEDSDDQPLVTLDEVTEEDEDFLEDFNRLKEEFSFVTVDEVGSEEEEEEEKPGLSTGRKLKESTKTAPEEEADRDVPFSATLENFKIPAAPLPEPRESAPRDELPEEKASADQPEDPPSENPKAEEEVDLGREKAELESKEEEEGRGVEQTDPVAETDSGCKQPPTEPVANQKEQSSSSKRSGSQEKQQSLGRMESDVEQPETKQRKVESAEKPKASSQLKDLDFLVPKAGYFCQICSCFCVFEESMKSHCLSQLHQQNMEKFMIKSTAEEKEGTEKESLT